MMKLSAGGTDIDDGWRDSVTEYDLAGNVTKVKDDGNHETTMVYDNLGRLSTTTDSIGNTTTLSYDAVGNITTSVYAESGSGGMTFTTSMTYDVLNRVSTSTDPASKVTTFSYDVRNLTKVTDPNGNDRTSKFNEQGWLLESKVQKDASTWLTTKWEYDKNGRMTKTKDAKDYATEYFYDQLDRQTRQKFNDTYSIYYTYDTHSNIVTREDQNATKVVYHYDLADRLTKKTYSITAAHIGGESTEKLFAYDALNRMTSAQDSDSKILYTYNTASLVESEEERYGASNLSSTGKTVEWDYDAQGLVTALRYPGASSTDGQLAYVYDNSNRLIQINRIVSSSTELVAEWSVLGAGRIVTRTNGNATRTEFQHDARGSVTGITHKHEEGTTDRTLSQFNYAYDDAGRMKAEAIKIYRNNGTTFEDKGFTFLYDKADRLTLLYRDVPSATSAANPPATYGKKAEYAFDENGNRNTVTYTPSGGSAEYETYSSNNTNAYTNVVWPNSTNTEYEYDKAGNRTWQTDTDKFWEYDYQNKLVRVSNGDDVYCEYDYDALGRRMEKRYNWLDIKFDTVKRFYYAGAMLIQEYDVRTVEESLVVALECDYVWGQSLSEPIQLRLYDIETSTLLDTIYYHQNLTGSVYQITDDSSSAYIEENYRYEEYGVPTVYVGDTTTVATEPFGNKLLWHADIYDFEVVNLASGLSILGTTVRGDPETHAVLTRSDGIMSKLGDFGPVAVLGPIQPSNPIETAAASFSSKNVGLGRTPELEQVDLGFGDGGKKGPTVVPLATIGVPVIWKPKRPRPRPSHNRWSDWVWRGGFPGCVFPTFPKRDDNIYQWISKSEEPGIEPEDHSKPVDISDLNSEIEVFCLLGEFPFGKWPLEENEDDYDVAPDEVAPVPTQLGGGTALRGRYPGSTRDLDPADECDDDESTLGGLFGGRGKGSNVPEDYASDGHRGGNDGDSHARGEKRDRAKFNNAARRSGKFKNKPKRDSNGHMKDPTKMKDNQNNRDIFDLLKDLGGLMGPLRATTICPGPFLLPGQIPDSFFDNGVVPQA